MDDVTGAQLRKTLKLSSAGAALAAGLMLAPTAAHAQQVVPGNDPECPIVMVDGEQVAICEGDLSGGVTASPATPDYDQIIIRNTTAPIAPPGFFGVGLVKDNGDLDILIEEGVVISVFDDPNIGGVAQGIIAIAQNGFSISLEIAADITADGNGSFALGIEAVSQDAGGEVLVINRGDVDAFTTGDSAIAVQARGDTFAAVSNPGGNLTAQSNGTGERNTVTAGILAVANNGTFRILNDLGDISVETGAGTFDTDFNGIAGALVGNAFNSRGGSSVSNTGNLTAVGPQTHGIVGFVQSIDASLPAQLNITTGSASADETSISTNGIGSFGILAQGAGENVIIDVLSNSAIDMTAVGGTSTGIFALNQAEEGSLTVTNRGTITGRGDTMRGLGATTFGAPVDGDYLFDITNEGDITLDAPLGFGITAFATRDDDVDATIDNSGNIDLSATTDINSIGITASFGNADPNADPMADGDSSVAITNSGDVTMGAGVAIFAAADTINVTNSGDLTTNGDNSDIVRIGDLTAGERFEEHLAILTFEGATLSSSGDNSAGIFVQAGPDADWNVVSVLLQDTAITTSGTSSNAIDLGQIGGNAILGLTVLNGSLSTQGNQSNAVRLEDALPNSVTTASVTGTSITTQGDDSSAVLIASSLHSGSATSDETILIVAIDNTEIETAGDRSAGIDLAVIPGEASTSAFTVEGSQIATLGEASDGISFGSVSGASGDSPQVTFSVLNSVIATQGDDSRGIFANPLADSAFSSGTRNFDAHADILIQGTAITTLGARAHGIELIGTTAMSNPDVTSDIEILASENITAAGLNSDAIRITNQGQTLISANNGATVSGGTGDAVAIRLAGIDESAEPADEVERLGTLAKAKIADNAMNIVTSVATGDGTRAPITLDMLDASGFSNLIGVDNATVESMMGAGAIVTDGALAVEAMNGAIIRTGEFEAPVISAVDTLAIVASDTTFSSTGDFSPLFNLSFNEAEEGASFYGQFTDITATTTGFNSDAIRMHGGIASGGISPSGNIGVVFLRATDPMAPNTISTMGRGAAAIDFRAGTGSTFIGSIADTVITTQGVDAQGVNILNTTLGSTNLELFDSSITTAGDFSQAVRLQSGNDANHTLIFIDSTLRSEGDSSSLIQVSQRGNRNVGNFVMVGSEFSTIGDEARGVWYQDAFGGASSYSFFISESSVTTAGADSDGFHFGRHETGDFSVGSFIFQNSEITTSGLNSDALQIGSLGNGSIATITAFDSRFVTQGDGSHALVSEALGNGSVTAVSVAGSSFATSGANSTAMLINDRSPLDANLDTSSSIFSIAISDSSITTMGTNSLGIDIASLAGDFSTTVISLADNQVSTQGANSDAISIGTQAAIGRDGASHSVSIDLSTIETSGDDSRGIYIGSLVDGLVGVYATNGGVTNATIFTADNVIATSGARSHGMEYATITGDLEDGIVDIVAGNSTIQTRGDNAVGMLFGGVDGAFVDSMTTDRRPQLSMVFSPLSIATEGAGSHAIQIGDLPAFDVADNASVTLTLLTRTVTTTGDGAHGVVIGSGWGDADSDTNFNDPGSNRFAQITVDGAINVSGAVSHGIVSDSLINDFSIAETGSITSADGFALKFDTVGEDFTALNAGTINGDVIFGGGDDVFDSSGTFTGNIDMGAGANSIFIRAGGLFNSLDTILLGAGNGITIEGDLSPGGVGPFQTTAIGSDLFFEPGSRFLVDIDGMTADVDAAGFFVSDRITVDGNITIEDATLAISSLTAEGDFDRSAQFLILDAAGTVSGEFSAIDADLPFLNLSLTYDLNQVILNAGRSGPVVPFASLGLTPNQRAVGASFDALEMDATGDLDDVIEQLIFASTDQALTAFDSASGEIYASLLAQAGNDGLRRSRESLARARMATSTGWGVWGGASFSDGSIDGDGNAADVSQDDFGFDFGMSYVGEGNRWAAGVSTGFRNGDLSVADRASAAEYDSWYVSGHVRYGSGGTGATLAGAISYANTDADVSRVLSVNALTRTALGNADVDTFGISAEGRYGLSVGVDWSIGPVVSIIHADSDLSLDDETEAGSVALASADASDGQTRFGVGLFANHQTGSAIFDLSGQYVAAKSNSVGAKLAFAEGGNAPFTVFAPLADGSGFAGATSARFELGKGWSIGAQIDAFIGADQSDVSGSATIGLQF